MVLGGDISKMIKKIIMIIGLILIVVFIGNANLKGNSVYYAKNSLSSNIRDLELMMLVDNLDNISEKNGFKYKYKSSSIHSIKNEEKNTYFSNSIDEGEYIYSYSNSERINYYFNNSFKLEDIIDFGNGMKYIDISTVDENKLKEEIYENFKPVLEELENEKPFINLQWIFNWIYRDRIK